MKFLIQTNNRGRIEHDFGETLIKMKEGYDKWSPSDKIIEADFSTLCNLETFCSKTKDIIEWTPVGSIPFVSEFVRIVFNTSLPEPLNVPEELMSELYTGRICRNIISCKEAEELLEYVKLHRTNQSTKSDRFFIKSLDIIKDPDNGFYDVVKDIYGNGSMTMEGRLQATANGADQVHKIFDYNVPAKFVGCQVSTILDEIISEWRVFVYKGEGVDVKNYAGDPFAFPDVHRIKEFIEQFKSAPESYTLDVAVTRDGTWVLECHDFFSCGLYGFNNYRVYPWMLSRAWYNIVHNKLDLFECGK